MSDENIFNSDQEVKAVTPNPAPADIPLPPEVQEFVGEGKKYKSLQDALKSIPHAQAHIQNLERELTEAKTEAAKARAMDELFEEINKSRADTAPQTPPASSNTPDIDINGAVEEVLARRESQKVAKENADKVISAFYEKFGDQSEAQFIKLAEENGMPLAYLNTLAQTSPQVVLKLAGMVAAPKKDVPHTTSTVKTEGSFNTAPQDLSAKVPLVGASTKDVLAAWNVAGIKAKLQNS